MDFALAVNGDIPGSLELLLPVDFRAVGIRLDNLGVIFCFFILRFSLLFLVLQNRVKRGLRDQTQQILHIPIRFRCAFLNIFCFKRFSLVDDMSFRSAFISSSATLSLCP